jgi:hypothetical protein
MQRYLPHQWRRNRSQPAGLVLCRSHPVADGKEEGEDDDRDLEGDVSPLQEKDGETLGGVVDGRTQ